MTFTQLIKQFTSSQVDTWWESIAPIQAPENVQDENWKYKLLKNHKTLPFKWSIVELAKHYGISFNSKDFHSSVANRDAFCEAFDFEIQEDLVFDETENKAFLDFYKIRVVNKEVFQSFIAFANESLEKNSIDPYKIRMALTSDKKKATLIIGMRAVLQYTETNGSASLGFILQNDFLEKLNYKNFESIYSFKGIDSPKSFVTLIVKSWNEIPIQIIENNITSVKEQYDLIKDTKKVSWNVEANSTNNVLKYLIFKGENVEEWVKKNTIILPHYSKDFFKEYEFVLLHETKGKKQDSNNPDLVKAYKTLKEAYSKVEFWTKQTTKSIIPNGLIKINKRPTNQANNFDGYLWSKIYPSLKDMEDEWLAITLGLDSNYNFIVKIDTVGLKKGLEFDYYLKMRGDFNNSPLVKIINFKDSRVKDWNGLLNFTAKSIDALIGPFKEIKLHFSLDSSSPKSTQTMNTKLPLNQILYGPPGTGKTYNTINKSLEIINDEEVRTLNWDNRVEVKKLFEKKVGEGLIVFTTFHQSMSYEDFIEGIKPETKENNIFYDVVSGIFLEICNIAENNWEDAREGNIKKLSFEDAFFQLKEEWIENEEIKFPLKTEGKDFTIIGFTKKSIQFKKASGGTGHTLSIATLKDYYNNKKEIRQTGVGIYYPSLLDKLNKYQPTKTLEKILKNYVIIIDEINRGNVSQIFGELITLIEEDKRLGNNEALEVTLPYSKEKFGVPPNLYVIGTMNTADRSVEALDTALRRRFTFKELMPNSKIVKEKSFEDYTRVEIMEKINNRVELLLDRNHTLGHAYFIKDDFKHSFENEIIPLLQEYFYNDYGKIGLVLGQGFVREKSITVDKSKSVFADFATKNEVDISKCYEMIPFSEVNFDFDSAIAQLLA